MPYHNIPCCIVLYLSYCKILYCIRLCCSLSNQPGGKVLREGMGQATGVPAKAGPPFFIKGFLEYGIV